MKAAVIMMLAGACVAQGQVNAGFETGDFTGFRPLPGPDGNASIVTQTNGGLSPFGTYAAKLIAGNATQAEAEAMMDLAPGRLAELYTDLGGDGDAQAGDYNILRIDQPAGDIYFWWNYEHGDIEHTTYLDHAFVVNGRGEITKLADGFNGGIPSWQNLGVPHPGGPLYFVCANGGDQSADPNLYIDDVQYFDPTNPSFGSGLAKWNIEDAGANSAIVVGQSIEGKSPTDGALMLQLTAGEMSQAAANTFLKLDPGALEDLVEDLGGLGDVDAGDYAIAWQDMPVGEVTFDWVVEGGDVNQLSFLDHAFAVNGAGEISVVYSSVDGLSLDWETVTVPHPGGKFFVVVANGGDVDLDPRLYVDNFRTGSTIVDSQPSWTAESSTGNVWGDGNVETFGQTFLAEGTSLERMTFHVIDNDGEPIDFEAYVYAWDGQKAVGEAVFASGPMQTDGEERGFEPVVIETPGARLVEGEAYIAFLTVSNMSPTNGNARFGITNADVIDGHFMFNDNNTNFAQLLGFGWGVEFVDLACSFEFGEAGKASAPTYHDTMYGGHGNAWPWNAGSSFRYQQVYRADQLDGAGVLDKFTYRVNPATGQKFTKTVNCQIFLGHTDKDPTALSTTFNENFTDDKVMVVDGAVVLSSAGHNGFDIVVDVPDIFEYNGTDNLIMEIVIPDGSNTGLGAFDAGTAQNSGAGNGPSAAMNRVSAFGAGSATGQIDKWDGLATRFEFLAPAAPCMADCDENDQLNILDFVCYQFLFEQGDARADCDGNGQLNILDFVCYQTAFQNGCN